MSSKIPAAALLTLRFGVVARQVNASSKPLSLVKHTGVIPGGFPYSAFNGGAKVRPEAMANAVETVRGLVFNFNPGSKSQFLDGDKIYKDYFIFIGASTMEVDNKFYDYDLCKGPLSFEVELDHVGKTSMQLKTSFFLEGIPNPIVTSRVSSVLVCNKTRMPKPPPDWWVEKYRNGVEGDNASNSIGRLEFDKGDHSQSTESHFRILPSDCDGYRHTNWSNYIRHCNDAYGEHLISKLGRQGIEEYYSRGVRCLSIHFKKESSVGDLLTVKVSPENSEDRDNIFYFNVENEAKEAVCQSKIEYYPPMAE